MHLADTHQVLSMAPAFQPSTARRGSRLLGMLSVLATILAAVYLLFPNPLADTFFTGWVVFSVIIALVGGFGVWTNRSALVWISALLMTVLSIVGMWSIGFFIAPAALLLLGAAVLSQLAGPRQGVRETIIANPPPARQTAMRAAAGIGSILIGGWLLNIGAFGRELFGACASETLACALDKTHWDAVGIMVLGLLVIGFGGWFLWKQIYVARVLAAKQTG